MKIGDTAADKILHRVARGTTPWKPYTGTKFNERFDDPRREFFVLYASSNRLACFVECLAYFRESSLPHIDELSEFNQDHISPAEVPVSWCHDRFSQAARSGGIFAGVAGSAWLAFLNDIVPYYLRRGQTYLLIDQSTIHQARFRAVTQWISRTVYEHEDGYAGIYYTSRHGDNFSNWALFASRANISEIGSPAPIRKDDADLLEACALLRIQPPDARQAAHSHP